MLKAVIFDLDGTLIDSTDAIVASHDHLFDTIGEPRPTREAVIASIGYPLHEGLPRFTSQPLDTIIPIYREHYMAHSAEQTFLHAGAEACLEGLRGAGLRLGWASSKKREGAEMLLAHLGVIDYFDARIGPDEVTHPKPHPEALHKACEQLGISVDEAIFVGDMFFDVRCAQAAGMRCYAVTTGYETREQLEALEPDAVFDSLLEVRDCVLAEVQPAQA